MLCNKVGKGKAENGKLLSEMVGAERISEKKRSALMPSCAVSRVFPQATAPCSQLERDIFFSTRTVENTT